MKVLYPKAAKKLTVRLGVFELACRLLFCHQQVHWPWPSAFMQLKSLDLMINASRGDNCIFASLFAYPKDLGNLIKTVAITQQPPHWHA